MIKILQLFLKIQINSLYNVFNRLLFCFAIQSKIYFVNTTGVILVAHMVRIYYIYIYTLPTTQKPMSRVLGKTIIIGIK